MAVLTFICQRGKVSHLKCEFKTCTHIQQLRELNTPQPNKTQHRRELKCFQVSQKSDDPSWDTLVVHCSPTFCEVIEVGYLSVVMENDEQPTLIISQRISFTVIEFTLNGCGAILLMHSILILTQLTL